MYYLNNFINSNFFILYNSLLYYMLKINDDIEISKIKMKEFNRIYMIINVKGTEFYATIEKSKVIDYEKITNEFIKSDSELRYKEHKIRSIENCLSLKSPRIIIKAEAVVG